MVPVEVEMEPAVGRGQMNDIIDKVESSFQVFFWSPDLVDIKSISNDRKVYKFSIAQNKNKNKIK